MGIAGDGMADVFLSYSSKDREAAKAVEAALTAEGFDVFWDQETPPGTDWDTWIRSKLSSARVVIVLWSRTSMASPNVRHEAMVARDAGKLVPVMVETLKAEDFPMGLYMVQGLKLEDWRNRESPSMQRLIAEIGARVGERPKGNAGPIIDRIKVRRYEKGVGFGAASRTMSPQASGKPSLTMPIAAGAAGLAVLVAGAIWFFTMQRPAPPPAEIAAPSATPVAEASSSPPTPSPSAVAASFSTRMLGRWTFRDGQACKDGPNITRDGDRLVFTTPGARFIHIIETDRPLETLTRVLAPESDLGQKYRLTPEFFATSETRSFTLVVENLSQGTKDTWTPCELKE